MDNKTAPLIFTQIPKIMGLVGSIEKKRQGDGIRYKFRGIDDVYLALQKLLADNYVFYVPHVLEMKREERQSKQGGTITFTVLTVRFEFFAQDGSSCVAVVPGEAMDSSDKSCNKAMSAALKVALLQTFCIPTEEPKDTEEHQHEVQPKSAAPKSAMPKIDTTQETRPSPAQLKRLFAIASQYRWQDADLRKYLWETLGLESTKDLTWVQYEKLCQYIEAFPGKEE